MENRFCFWAQKSPQTRMKPKKNGPVIYCDRPIWLRECAIHSMYVYFYAREVARQIFTTIIYMCKTNLSGDIIMYTKPMEGAYIMLKKDSGKTIVFVLMFLFYIGNISAGKNRIDIRRLFNDYYNMMMGTAIATGCNVDDAEDCIQSVFERILSNPKIINNINNFESYLEVAVRNAAYNLFRSRARNKDMIDKLIKLPEEELMDPEKIAEGKMDQIEKIYLRSLKDEYKDIIILHDLYGKDYGTIAFVFGISKPAARKRYNRAIKDLRAALKTMLKEVKPHEIVESREESDTRTGI